MIEARAQLDYFYLFRFRLQFTFNLHLNVLKKNGIKTKTKKANTSLAKLMMREEGSLPPPAVSCFSRGAGSPLVT